MDGGAGPAQHGHHMDLLWEWCDTDQILIPAGLVLLCKVGILISFPPGLLRLATPGQR